MKVPTAVMLAVISGVVVISLAYIFVICEDCTKIHYDPDEGLTMERDSEPSASNKPPTAIMNPDGGVFETGEQINFSGGKSTDPDGDRIDSFLWNFGDENTDSGMSVSHRYNSPGEYTVVMEATDSKGASGNAYAIITIQKSGSTSSPGSATDYVPIQPPQTNAGYFVGDWTGTGYFTEGFDKTQFDGKITFRNDGSFLESNSAGKDMFGEGVYRYNDKITPTLTMNRDFFTVVGKSENAFTIIDPFGGDRTKVSFTRE